MVGFYLHSEPFPNIPKFEHVAFCWHHKALSPGKPQHVILARPEGVAPFPTNRPQDLGSLIYRRWDSSNHRDLHTIDCQGSCTITYFDYTSLCWRRVRRDFPRGPAGSIVAFPVEASSSKADDKQLGLQHSERVDEDVYEAAKILLAMKHSTRGLSGAPACVPGPSESYSEVNEKQLDFDPNGLTDEEEKEDWALTVSEQEHNRGKAGTAKDGSAKSGTARAAEEERSLELSFARWLGA
ncbi:MAG: hypothetical protein Q9198_002722 [Flavoplaca austrocitrina]